jgi:hypothetical protein
MIDDWPAPRPPAPAQTAATLRVLEAVDDLRRDVDSLRAEIGGGSRGALVSGAVVRVGVECALLVAVATFAGVGRFRPLVIVALMGAALAALVVAECLASRAAYVPARFGFVRARPADVDPPPETPLESDAWELARL